MSDISEKDTCDPTPAIPKITLDDIQQLLLLFSKKTYNATADDEGYKTAHKRVLSLLQENYRIFMIDNTMGNLSYNYPSQIPIIDSDEPMDETLETNMFEMMKNARLARCHGRFPVPVIYHMGRYICRSSTLSGGPEILGRMGCQYFRSRDTTNSNSPPTTAKANRPAEEHNEYPEEDDEDDIEGNKSLLSFLPSLASVAHEWQFFNKVRNYDIKLLKALNIDTIFDLMVENKKVKFGLYVSSSEKIDKERRYADFNIVSIPYPGCEFFKEFRNNNMNSDKLFFQWRVAYCNANLCLPDNPPLTHLNINWTMYQQWDLTTLTKNYMKYILKYFQESNSGILIHCISGWDRTPMFVSLIRLSLWADGLIHKGLNELEILYFTLAYDWMLFGHHLCDRLKKEEDIFVFAFHFLKHLSSYEFSILTPISKKQKLVEPKLEARQEPEEILEFEAAPQINVVEKDPLGSNLSLSSVGSSTDCKPQDEETTGNTPGLLPVGGTDASVPPLPLSRQASSVNVPIESALKYSESPTTTCTIQGGDTWQHVTSTGSLKGSDSSNSQDSNCTTRTLDEDFPELFITPKVRKDRLTMVRNNFYKAYWTTIGKDVPQYKSNPLFTTIMNEVAEKVKTFTQK